MVIEETKHKEEKRKRAAVYPISGDPFHNGHLYVLETALKDGLFDKVYLTLGNNSQKKHLFSLDERIDLAEKAIYGSLPKELADKNHVEVTSYNGIMRNYALEKGAKFIIRGIRESKDADFERALSDYNAEYGLRTILALTREDLGSVSSSMVKEIVKEAGFVDKYVHPAVKQALEEKIRNVELVAVTGNLGSGKSSFSKEFAQYCNEHGLEANHIDLDKVIQGFYHKNNVFYKQVRQEIEENFGNVFEGDELDRKKLSAIVFGDDKKRAKLTRILKIPTIIALENLIKDMQGLVLIDAAYFVEYNLLPLTNYNAILVRCDEEERIRRVYKRDIMTEEELKKKVKSQIPSGQLKKKILEYQEEKQHGFFYEVDKTHDIDFKAVYDQILNKFPFLKNVRKQVD